MRRAFLVMATCLVLLAVGAAADPLLDMFRSQVEIEKRLQAADLASLERVQGQIDQVGDRLVRLSADLLRAEREGEDVISFAARNADLGRAEAELNQLIVQSQQLRAGLAVHRAYLDQLQIEVKRLEEAQQGSNDELTGRWNVVIEPGGQRGSFDLRLDGTIVSGVYQLSGGWKGSLRGTLIGEALHLERIDAQQGFVAVYNGRFVTRGGEKRLEGSWEATGLNTGGAAAGSWLARREQRQ
jgi:hypothetical protein